jgi:hypothetical protein
MVVYIASVSPYVAGVVAAAVVYLVLYASKPKKRLPLPPGPKQLPIIGNLVRSDPNPSCRCSQVMLVN